MQIIKINGVIIPDPSSLEINTHDLDSPDTFRNELGVLKRYRVRRNVYKISLSFKAKRGSDIQLIESAIEEEVLNVTFPSERGLITKQMYVGDRNKNIVLMKNKSDDIRWDMSFNLVEY